MTTHVKTLQALFDDTLQAIESTSRDDQIDAATWLNGARYGFETALRVLTENITIQDLRSQPPQNQKPLPLTLVS